MKKTFLATALLSASLTFAAAPTVIPSLQSWKDGTADTAYTLKPDTCVLTAADAPQSVKDAAALFAGEIGRKAAVLGNAAAGGIVLKLDATLSTNPEAYRLEVKPDGILLTGASDRALIWGTRTLLQVFAAQKNTFPCGTADDAPDYPARGFMFDCGRKPTSLPTLYSLVDICAYYKMNELQLHLSDNYIWLHRYPVKTAEDMLKYEPSPSAFRLESKIPGLTSPVLSYTKQEFRDLIEYARRRGVTLIPELDVPGHALALVRVRPDLMYRGPLMKNKKEFERAAMLDLAKEETFTFVSSLFDEYIDGGVFTGPIVHIGTDEYYGDNESYRKFTDRLLRHIRSKGKTPRLWGSFSYKTGKTPVNPEGVQMHIWNTGWQNPQAAINGGYDIVNIQDHATYSVPDGKGSIGGYGDDIDAKRLYNTWTPNIFFGGNALPEKHKQLLGGAWAMWNDHSFLGDPGLSCRDLLDRIRRNCAVIGLKCWKACPPSAPYETFLNTLANDGCPTDVRAPQWTRTYTVTRRGNAPLKLATGAETDLYAVSPVNGKIGYRSEGNQFTFDVTLPEGKPTTLTFEAKPRSIRLLVDGKPVPGNPKRQFFPENCRYFSVAAPERDIR